MAVAFEVGADLIAGLEGGEIFVEGLDLDDAAFWLEFAEERVSAVAVFFQFFRGKKAAIVDACAVVGGVDDGGDFWFERFADSIEKVGEGGVAGSLGSARAQGGVELGKIRFNRMHKAMANGDGGGMKAYFQECVVDRIIWSRVRTCSFLHVLHSGISCYFFCVLLYVSVAGCVSAP